MLEAQWDPSSFDKAFAALEQECTEIVRGITIEAFLHTLDYSPQWFGRFVSNWNYSVGAPDPRVHGEFDLDPSGFGNDPRVRAKGDSEAIDYARGNNANRAESFKLGDTVFFSNSVDHGEGSYAQAIEAGTITLRDVNLPGRPAGRALDRAAAWYSNRVNPSHVERLRKLRIGV